MAGLFETPEEVRARIGRTGREQDLSLAGMSGAQMANFGGAQAGRLFAQALGGEDPQIAKAKKIQSIMSNIDSSDPYKGMMAGVKDLFESGYAPEALMLAEKAKGFAPDPKKKDSIWAKVNPKDYTPE